MNEELTLSTNEPGDSLPSELLQANAAERREFLNREADHFFQAEIQHENRANWILVIASGALYLFLSQVSPVSASSIETASRWLLIAGSLMASISCLLACVAIWPLEGARARWGGIRRTSAPRAPNLSGDFALRHYLAHRSRASVRARQVSRAIVALVIALLLLGACAALKWLPQTFATNEPSPADVTPDRKGGT